MIYLLSFLLSRLRALCIVVGAIGLFFLSPTFATGPAHAEVIINEIYPKTSDVTWEWVELYNTGSESVWLDRWRLQNSAGDVFILNASATIAPYGFLTFTGSQTAIAFSIEGDTVRLFDEKNNQVDSQSYPGTLGYNTSVGRSTDGGDGWVICSPDPYNATPNKPNNCPPAPTPMPTSTPTNTPIPTPYPTATPIPTSTPTPIQQTFGSLLPSPTGTHVLGATDTMSPTPTPTADVLQFAVSKTRIAYILLGIAAAALSLMVILWLRERLMRKKKFTHHE